MAKETEFNNNEIKIGENPEFDEFDFDYDEELFGDDLMEEPDSREPVSVKNVAKNIKKKFKETSALEIQNAIENTMPSKIKNEYSAMKDVFSSATEEITNQSSKIKNELKDLSGKITKFLPEGSKIQELLKKFSEKESSYSGPSEEERRENEIMDNVASSLGDLSQIQEKSNLLNNILEDKRTESTNELLKEILKSSNATKLFNFEYTSKWQRKTLELSYRQTYFLKDLLEVTKESSNKIYEQLTAITLNTSLPDVVKQKQSEMFMADLKSSFRSTALNGFVKVRDSLLDNIKQNLKSRIKDVGEQTQDMLFAANNNIDLMESGANLDTKSGNIASSIKDSVLNFGADGLWKLVGKSNVGKKAFRLLKSTIDNPANIFRSFNDKLDDKNFMGADLLRTLSSEAANILDVKADKEKASVDRLVLDDPAIFDNRVKKTVINVIPGYLRKIHAEIAALRAGDKKGSIEKYELSYNYNSDTFVNKSNAANAMVKNFRELRNSELDNPMNNIKKLYSSEKMLESLGKDKLSEDELDKIAKAATIASTKTMAGGMELLKSEQFLQAIPEELRDKVTKANEKLYDLALDDLDIIDDARYYVDRLRASIPSMHKEIEELFHNGNIEELIALGIVKYNTKTKNYETNDDKIFELMFGDYTNVDVSTIRKTKDKNLFDPAKAMEGLKKKQEAYKTYISPKIEKFKETIKSKTKKLLDVLVTDEQKKKIKEEATNIKDKAKTKVNEAKEKVKDLKEKGANYVKNEEYKDDYENVKTYILEEEYKEDFNNLREQAYERTKEAKEKLESSKEKMKVFEAKLKEEKEQLKDKYKNAANETKDKLKQVQSKQDPTTVFADNNTSSSNKKEESFQDQVAKEKDVYSAVELLDAAEQTGDKNAVRSAMGVITKKGLANNPIVTKKVASAMQSIRNKESMANNMAKEIEKEKDPEKKMTLMKAAGKFAGMLPYSSVFKMLWGGMKMYVKAGRAIERFLLPKLGKGLMKLPGVAAAAGKFAGLVGWNSLKHSARPAGQIAKMGIGNAIWGAKQFAKAPFKLAGGLAKGLGGLGLWAGKKAYQGIEAAFAPEGDGPEFHGYDDYEEKHGKGKDSKNLPMMGDVQNPRGSRVKKKQKTVMINGMTKEEYDKKKEESKKKGKGGILDKILGVGMKMLSGIGSLVGFFTKKFAGLLTSAFSGALSKLGSLFKGGDLPDGPDGKKKGFLGRMWDGAKNLVKKGAGMVKDAAGYVAGAAVTAYKFAKEKTVAVAKKIGNIVSSAWDLAKHIGGKAFNAVKGALSVIGQTAGELINKCTNALKGLQNTLEEKVGKPILKRLGKVGAKKAMGKLAAKIAARLVPGAGLALLAWDLIVIAKEMAGGRPFLNSLVYGLIGFDPWDESTGDTFVDDDGSTIKPDKDVEEQKATEDTEPVKQEGEKEPKPIPQPKGSKIINKQEKSVEVKKPKEEEKPKVIDTIQPTYTDNNSNITAEEQAMMDGVKTKYQIEQEKMNREALRKFEEEEKKKTTPDSNSNLTDEEIAMFEGRKTPYQIEQERLNREALEKLDKQEKKSKVDDIYADEIRREKQAEEQRKLNLAALEKLDEEEAASDAEILRVEQGKPKSSKVGSKKSTKAVSYEKPVSAKTSENKAVTSAVSKMVKASQPSIKKVAKSIPADKLYKLFAKAARFITQVDYDDAYLCAKAISNLDVNFKSDVGFGIMNITKKHFDNYFASYSEEMDALGGDWTFGEKNYLDPWQQVFTGLCYYREATTRIELLKEFPDVEDMYSYLTTLTTKDVEESLTKDENDKTPTKQATKFREALGFAPDSEVSCMNGEIKGKVIAPSGENKPTNTPSSATKQKPKTVIEGSGSSNETKLATQTKRPTTNKNMQTIQTDNSELIAVQKESHNESLKVQNEGNSKLDRIADLMEELIDVNKANTATTTVNGKSMSKNTTSTPSISNVPQRHFNNSRKSF